jgi:signal transduction histidine kinase
VSRRILLAIVAVTALALVAFGVPLGVAVKSRFRSDELTRLEREAARGAARVPARFATSRDPIELPHSPEGVTLAVYGIDSRLVTGHGPKRGDVFVRRSLRGAPARGGDAGRLVATAPVPGNERVVAVVRAAEADAPVARRTHVAWLLMLGVGAGALGIAALVAQSVARRLSRPVSRLAETARRIGEGDFTARVETSGVAELDEVAGALHTTASQLDRLLSRERAFSADASHQLRTPLTALRLSLERALIAQSGSRDTLEGALALVDRLEETVDELLLLARDEHRDRGALEFDALLDAVDRNWRGALAERGRRLEIRLPRSLPRVSVSAAAIRQILEVLISNAVEHGAGTVTVGARPAGAGVVIDVRDEGPGVGRDAEQVFERRSSEDTRRGIGLALARSLAEAEGGRLVIARSSPAPVFQLFLPATPDGDSTNPAPGPQDGSAEAERLG